MKAVISKNQFDRIKNFINETKEIKKDEVIDEKKKLTKKQLRTFDVDNDGDIEADDMADLRAMRKITKKKSKKKLHEKESFPDLTSDGKVTRADILKGRGVELDESDCGCGGSEEPNDTRYMFFSNLEQMMRQARMLLQMDEDMLEDLLNNGHDWAADHIAEAKNNMDQVFDFIMGEMHGQGEDDSWGEEEDEDDEEMMYEEDDTLGSPEDARLKNPTHIGIRKKREFVTSKLSNDDFVEYFKAKALGKEQEFLKSRGFDDSLNKNLPSINEGMKLKKKAFVSKELKHHLDENIPLCESEFRYGSHKHIELIKEVKELYNKGLISLNEADAFIVDEFDPTPVKIKGIGEVYLGLIQEEFQSDEELLSEAVYKGKKVQLGKPKRGGSSGKKFYVYVRNPKTGKVKKVSFGAAGGGHNLAVKLRDPKAKKSFSARHNCPQKKDRTTSGYWSCRLPSVARSLGLSSTGGYW